jgi:hypothetical protein
MLNFMVILSNHVWRTGAVYAGSWWGNLRERDHLEDTSEDGKIILRWIFRKWDVRAWIGLMGLRTRQVAGCYECGNELAGTIKCGEFLD